MSPFRALLSSALAVLACALGCRGSSTTHETGGADGGGSDSGGASGYVVDEPSPGQAIITGTVQTFRWHGGSPSDVLDVWFVPATGAPVALATSVQNTGQTTATIHLLATEQRSGGAIVIQPTDEGAPPVKMMRGLRGHSDPSDGAADGEPDAGGEQGADAEADGGAPDTVKVGSLASFSWNGTAEDYFWIDVSTGMQQDVGTVGDLASWTMKTLAVDDTAERLYILGFDAAMTQKIYVLDSKTGALVSETPLQSAATETFLGLQLVQGPSVVAFTWDGSHEQMVSIDPGSGAVTTLGAVGDLMFWSDQTAYDPSSNTVYVLGMPGGAGPQPGPLTLYAMDATSGSLTSSLPVTRADSGVMDVTGLLANATGGLVGFDWNGTAEEVLSLDPTTGDVAAIGTVGDLATWDDIATINLTTDTIYVLGNTSAMSPKLYALDGASGSLLYSAPLSTAMLPAQASLVY